MLFLSLNHSIPLQEKKKTRLNYIEYVNNPGRVGGWQVPSKPGRWGAATLPYATSVATWFAFLGPCQRVHLRLLGLIKDTAAVLFLMDLIYESASMHAPSQPRDPMHQGGFSPQKYRKQNYFNSRTQICTSRRVFKLFTKLNFQKLWWCWGALTFPFSTKPFLWLEKKLKYPCRIYV